MADTVFKLHVRQDLILELKAPTLEEAVRRVAPMLGRMVMIPMPAVSLEGAVASATLTTPHPVEVHVEVVQPNPEAN